MKTRVKDVLVTGACGFIGSHLMDMLRPQDRDGRPSVLGTTYYSPLPGINLQDCMMMDVKARYDVKKVIRDYLPAAIYHLAAQSLPVLGQKLPQETIETNVVGTINLFEAILAAREDVKDYDPVVVVACSSAQYGDAITGVPVTEDSPQSPVHIYGVSKVAQDMLAYQYFKNHDIKAIRARIFNTTGPRKHSDVCSDLVVRMLRAKERGDTSIPVGNLESQRAILHVNDLCEALVCLRQRGKFGEAYNICADRAYPVTYIANKIMDVIGTRFVLEPANTLKRKNDEPLIIGDSRKIKALGWVPLYRIEDIIKQMVEHEQGRS